MSTEISTPLFTEEDLTDLTTFADVRALFDSVGLSGNIETMADYGTGFVVEKDKSRLVNVPFVIIEWFFWASEQKNEATGETYETEFASAYIMTERHQKIIINDGSSGIYKDLKDVTEKRLKKGLNDQQSRAALYAPNGLKPRTFTTLVPTREGGEIEKDVTIYSLKS